MTPLSLLGNQPAITDLPLQNTKLNRSSETMKQKQLQQTALPRKIVTIKRNGAVLLIEVFLFHKILSFQIGLEPNSFREETSICYILWSS